MMRKGYRLIAVFGMLLLGGIGSVNASLISNGAFDTDLSGWTISTTIATPSAGVTWIGGTAHIGRPGTPGDTVFSQEFDIPTGTTKLSISFDYEWQVSKPANEDFFTVEFVYKSTALDITELLLSEGSETGSFGTTLLISEMLSLTDINPVSPNGLIRFTLNENNTSNGTRIQLDNVTVSAVPEPAALALMGLGLAGIGYKRHCSKKAV